jgi:hypothetical protein
MLKNLLLYRLAILNLSGFAFAGWAWQLGYVEAVYAGDESRITLIITALFAVGLASAWVRARKISRLLNLSKENRALVVLGAKLLEKAAHLDDIVNWLVTLGLLGTVIGFAMALSGVDSASLASPAGVQKVAGQLMAGMRIAINTTIVGAVFGLWLDVNRRVVRTATVSLAEDTRSVLTVRDPLPKPAGAGFDLPSRGRLSQ